MNGNRADHESVNARLDDFVDGELSASARRDVEAHLEVCAGCRADLAARRELLGDARSLPRSVEPGRDLWPEIRSRMADRGGRVGRPSRRPALAAAATVTLVAGAAALALWFAASGDRAGAARTAERGAGGGGRDPVALAADWRSLEREYGGAAEELQQTLEEIGEELSPETRRIVEQNMRVIDEAIAESRAALERDPANRELARSLRAAWSSKVEMLQYVTRL